MAQILEQLRTWIEQGIVALGPVGVALFTFIETVFPPIPSEIVMPFAGFLVGQGRFTFVSVVLAGVVGSLVGALCIYAIGVHASEGALRRFVQRHGHLLLVSLSDYERALDMFERHGELAVFLGRLVPGVRSLVSLPAGLVRMPLPSFITYTVLGTGLWSSALAYVGFVLGENWREVLVYVERYEIALLALAGLVVAWLIARRVRRRHAGAE